MSQGIHDTCSYEGLRAFMIDQTTIKIGEEAARRALKQLEGDTPSQNGQDGAWVAGEHGEHCLADLAQLNAFGKGGRGNGGKGGNGSNGKGFGKSSDGGGKGPNGLSNGICNRCGKA